MPREPDPFNDEDLFDSVELGGIRSPGQVVSISGHDRELDWDIKVGAGTSGATTTLKAEKPAEITVTFFLADDADRSAWPAFRGLLFSTVVSKPAVTVAGRPATAARALDIYHPDLAANGIQSVVLKSFGGVVHDGKGGQTIAVKLLEYKPPKPVKVTPIGSTKAKGPDPDAALKKELGDLVNTNAATPWGHL